MKLKIMTMLSLILSVNTSLALEQEIDLNKKLCFYGEDHVDEPVRFVYLTPQTGEYMFVFMEEDNKTRRVFKSEKPRVQKDNLIYTKGDRKINKQNSQYFEICIQRAEN